MPSSNRPARWQGPDDPEYLLHFHISGTYRFPQVSFPPGPETPDGTSRSFSLYARQDDKGRCQDGYGCKYHSVFLFSMHCSKESPFFGPSEYALGKHKAIPGIPQDFSEIMICPTNDCLVLCANFTTNRIGDTDAFPSHRDVVSDSSKVQSESTGHTN